MSPIERGLVLIFLIVAAAFSVAPIRNQLRHGSTKDYPLWLDTGQRELHGQSPYYRDQHGEFPFMYPPGAAGLLAVASVAGKLPLMLLLVGLNTVAWAVCIVVPIWLVAGRVRGVPDLLYWLPSVLCILYVWSTYLEGQVVVVLLACLVGMFACLRLNRPGAAGLLLAAAAAFKAFPILAAPYLIYRRQWKALLFTGIYLAVLLLAVPGIFRGPSGAWADFRTWRVGMPSNYTPDMIGQRKERSYTWQNGSVISVANRLLRPIVADRDNEFQHPLSINMASLSFAQVNTIIGITGLLMGAAYLLVTPRERDRTRFSDAAEAAMLLILIVIFTPLSFTYLTAWQIPGIAVVLYFICCHDRAAGRRGLAIGWLACSSVMLVFSIRNPLFREIRASGNTLWSNLILLAELAWVLRVDRAATTRPATVLGGEPVALSSFG